MGRQETSKEYVISIGYCVLVEIMQKSIRKSLFVALFLCFSYFGVKTASSMPHAADDILEITVDGTNGFLQGKKLTTIGKNERSFITFRNIPFALEPERFMPPEMKNLDDVIKGTTLENPYDARNAGPMCEQSNRSPDSVGDLNDVNINDALENILADIDIPDIIPDNLVTPESILTILEEITGQKLNNKSVGAILDDWMDMQLSVSPDCLQLSVSMPSLPKDGKKLPVMVWVYGGAFYSGSNNLYGMERIGDVADVILVAINYRIGSLGFMCLDSDNAMGNMGLLDQVMSLRWVKKYIHHFGGDPNQVTIFGESAGSASVSHLLISNLTEGLFHRVIGQSGSALAGWAFDKEPEYHARRIAGKVGCDLPDQEDMILCLKDLPAINITLAHSEYRKEERSRGELGFGGTVPCAQTKGLDHQTFYFEGQHPADILRLGHYEHMPILYGANSHEGSYVYGVVYKDFILAANKSEDLDFLKFEFVDTLLRAVGIEQEYAFSDQIREKYFHEDQIGNLTAMTPGAIDMLGVFFIKASAYKMVEENSKHGKDSYFYSFERKSQKSFCHASMIQGGKPHDDFQPGVCHVDDLMYIFNFDIPLVLCNLQEVMPTFLETFAKCLIKITPKRIGECIAEPDSDFMMKHGECVGGTLTDSEKATSESMLRTWTNFAIHGVPNPETDPADGPPAQFIEQWTADNPVYMRFGSDGVSVQKDFKKTWNIALDEDDEKNGQT